MALQFPTYETLVSTHMKLLFHPSGTDSYVDLSIKVVPEMTKSLRKSKTSTWISFILRSEAHVAPDDDVLVPVRIDEDAS